MKYWTRAQGSQRASAPKTMVVPMPEAPDHPCMVLRGPDGKYHVFEFANVAELDDLQSHLDDAAAIFKLRAKKQLMLDRKKNKEFRL